MVYAGFWMRVAASILDSLALTVLAGVLGVLLAVTGLGILAGPLGFLFGLLYYPVLESSGWQATIGKRMVGLRVTDLEGRRISFWRALGRNLAKILSGLIWGIGYLMAGWTPRKQALHDMLAGCLVVVGNA